MADGDLQDGILRAMVDGQAHVNFGNLDIAHDPLTGYVQQAFVFGLLLLGEEEAVAATTQVPVILPGGVPDGVIAGVVESGHVFGVGGDGAGLVEGVPVVADGGVQQQGQPYEQ